MLGLLLCGRWTLALRMEQAASALAVCEFLSGLEAVSAIYHPAYSKDPYHELWQRDCHGSNGLLSVALRGSREQTRAFVDALQLSSYWLLLGWL